MKLNIKYIIGVAAVATLGMVSCTDEIKFGNAFLEKAPGGTVTADEVFPIRNIPVTSWRVFTLHSITICPPIPRTLLRSARTIGKECPMRWGMTSIFSSTIPQCFPNTMPVR